MNKLFLSQANKLLLLSGLASVTTVVAQSQVSNHPNQPNIIFILADDIGYEAFGCNGGTSYQTPCIDQMAQQGMLFTQAYSQPLSAPSRVQLMTGKYNFRNYEGFGVMSPETETFGDLMKDAGYITGITGKWQLHGNAGQIKLAGKVGSLPKEVGFDHYFVWHTTFPYIEIPDTFKTRKSMLAITEPRQRESRYKDPVILSEDGKFTYHDQYGPDLFLRWAENFIEENKDKPRPFFLYYSMVLMHDPFQATPDSKDWEKSNWKDASNPKYFGDMMGYMDKIIGRIIKKIEDAGIADNTLIIFTGDNGTNRKIVSTWNNQQIRGDKGSPKEWGIHVPFIVYWKNHIKSGSRNENMIDFTDLLPTFLEAAGSKIPNGYQCDGVSFYNQLLGKEDAQKRDWSFGYYDAKWTENFEKAVWIQDSSHTWKLYQNGNFYNLKKDPNETTPLQDDELTKQEKGIKKRLASQIEQILNS